MTDKPMSKQEADRILRDFDRNRKSELETTAKFDKEFPHGWTILCAKEAGPKDFQVHVPDTLFRLGHMVACLFQEGWSEVTVRPNAPLTPHDRPIHHVEVVLNGPGSIPTAAELDAEFERMERESGGKSTKRVIDRKPPESA